jgi:hypothetical protein
MTSTHGTGDRGQLPQGDLRLLDTDLAQRLLRSSIPARLAFLDFATRLPSALGGV